MLAAAGLLKLCGAFIVHLPTGVHGLYRVMGVKFASLRLWLGQAVLPTTLVHVAFEASDVPCPICR